MRSSIVSATFSVACGLAACSGSGDRVSRGRTAADGPSLDAAAGAATGAASVPTAADPSALDAQGGVGNAGGGVESGSALGTDASGPQVGRLFWLAIVGNQVISAAEDGGGARVLASGQGISAPDGVAVDVAGGKMYWTNMGTLTDGPHTPAGSVQRANLDGSGVEVLLKPGVTTNTPKQMQIDLVHKKIYWSDREGAKAWRANLDGSSPEVLLSGHGIQQLVGMALDVANGQFYVTDRYAKFILRTAFDVPAGQDAGSRTDVEQLVVESGSAEPIDIDLDLQQRTMYWTDRSLNTVQRASMDLPAGQTAATRSDIVTVVSGLSTPIGISLDTSAGTMYFTELGGQVFQCNLDGSGEKNIGSSSGASGITHVEVPGP